MRLISAFSFVLVWLAIEAGYPASQGFVPKDGFVPNAETAVKVAEAVLIPVYGKKTIESEEPFEAKRRGDGWIVSGTLHCPHGEAACLGGTAAVEISKADARIISMTHYK